MRQARIIQTCHGVHEILTRYYGFDEVPDFVSFLLPAEVSLGVSGRLLFRESPDGLEVSLGFQFGDALEKTLEQESSLALNTLAVVAEETSHLQLVMDAARLDLGVTVLDLEVLGEIDRFLALMHWNARDPHHPLDRRWRNLHDVCDHVFAGARFPKGADPLYFDVEEIALAHLKRAFSRTWDCSRFDFRSVDKGARAYLRELRHSLFQGRFPPGFPRASRAEDALQLTILSESA